MKAIDKALKMCDAEGVHRITYKDINGKTQTETIKGNAAKLRNRVDELREHECKILKEEAFINWRE